MRKTLSTILLVLVSVTSAHAAEIGHYAGGLANIRDFFIPEPGFYGMLYNYYYKTDRLNDHHGNEIRSVNINPGPGPGVTVNIDPNVDVYVLAPMLMWVAPWKVLGGHYAAYAVPTFANSSVGASLSTANGQGVDAQSSQFGVGDLFVQPLWLGWSLTHWEMSMGWGFYSPTGKYDTSNVNVAGVGALRLEKATNIGLGFWTNQFQGAVAWYPFDNKGTAITGALTYEVHSEKEDYHLTAGQDLTFNWGISQYLPLTKDMNWLLEVGPAGYDTWQVTHDSGRDAHDSTLDQVHGVGAQVGLTSVGWAGVLNFHYFHEVGSESRFQGDVVGLSIAKKI